MLDTSVALSWCFEDERTAESLELLDRVAESGATAPALFPLEALNTLFVAERRRRLSASQRADFTRFLHLLPIRLDVHTATQAWQATSHLAAQYGLTPYDACYLELAQRRQLPLASFDKALQRAATLAGVERLA